MGFLTGRANIGLEHKGKQEVPFFKVRSSFWKNLIFKETYQAARVTWLTEQYPRPESKEAMHNRREAVNVEQYLEDTERIHPWLESCTQIHRDSSWAIEETCQMVVSVLAQQASKPTSDPTDIPMVCLESDNGNIMIQKYNDITVAGHKMTSGHLVSSLPQPVTGTQSQLVLIIL